MIVEVTKGEVKEAKEEVRDAKKNEKLTKRAQELWLFGAEQRVMWRGI